MHTFVHGAFLDAGCHVADHGEAGSRVTAPTSSQLHNYLITGKFELSLHEAALLTNEWVGVRDASFAVRL